MAIETSKLVAALRRKRDAEGLSLRGLSSIIGISFSTLARVERGEGVPDNNTVVRILEWLGEDGREAGLSFDSVAFVHFRATKNVRSKTVHCLLRVANIIKQQIEFVHHNNFNNQQKLTSDPFHNSELGSLALSKSEMEDMAAEFRRKLDVTEDGIFDALRLRIDGIDMVYLNQIPSLEGGCLTHLRGPGCREWSAMSVPFDLEDDRWTIVLNDRHTIERQRVTYLEECWHVLLGHKPTRIAKVADVHGRTYDSSEEHDAFYLASATLLPKRAIEDAVNRRKSAAEIGARFGVSPELVEYRIKRLGLWMVYKGKQVSIS